MVTSVDYFESVLIEFYPVFYGGYVDISRFFNNTIKVDKLYNNGSKSEIFQEAIEVPQIKYKNKDDYIEILQKQNMIWYVRIYDDIFWSIDYYQLNSVDSNGKIICHTV